MRTPRKTFIPLTSSQLCSLAGPHRERLMEIAVAEYHRCDGDRLDLMVRVMQAAVRDYEAALNGRSVANPISHREGMRAVRLLQDSVRRRGEQVESAYQFARVLLFEETGVWIKPRLDPDAESDTEPVPAARTAPGKAETATAPVETAKAQPQEVPVAEPVPQAEGARQARASHRYIKQILRILERRNVSRVARNELRRQAREQGWTEAQVHERSLQLIRAA